MRVKDGKHLEFNRLLPNGIEPAVVEIATVHVGVDFETPETEVVMGPFQFDDGGAGMVHREVGDPHKSIGPIGDHLSNAIILLSSPEFPVVPSALLGLIQQARIVLRAEQGSSDFGAFWNLDVGVNVDRESRLRRGSPPPLGPEFGPPFLRPRWSSQPASFVSYHALSMMVLLVGSSAT
jgi:hypothetical protein